MALSRLMSRCVHIILMHRTRNRHTSFSCALLYCALQVLCFCFVLLQTEDLWQPCIEQVYRCHFSIAFACFMRLCHISIILTVCNLFRSFLFVIVVCDLWCSMTCWRRKWWHPTPVFLPGESQGRGSLMGCRLWGRTELDTTEAT